MAAAEGGCDGRRRRLWVCLRRSSLLCAFSERVFDWRERNGSLIWGVASLCLICVLFLAFSLSAAGD